MRLDFYHTGTGTEEVFSLDRAVVEPLPWPGNPRQAADDSNFGKYLFAVRDAKTNRILHAGSHTVGQGGFRELLARDSGAPPADQERA